MCCTSSLNLPIMKKDIFSQIVIIMIPFLVAIFTAWITLWRSSKERNRLAAEKFREEVISAAYLQQSC